MNENLQNNELPFIVIIGIHLDMPIYGNIIVGIKVAKQPLVAVPQDGLLLVQNEYVELAEKTYETVENINNN